MSSAGAVLMVLCACSASDPDLDLANLESDGSESALTEFLEELHEVVPPLLEANNVPGTAVGIIHNGTVLQTLGFGFADNAKHSGITDQHLFNVGSISKVVAAWGVMHLVDQGALDLDKPVADYLSRWQLPNSEFDHSEVTPRRLLSHTAGLSLSGYPGFLPGQKLPSIEASLSGATNGAGAVEVEFAPGSKWQYSGGGYTLLQLLIEEISGKSFADYMETEVLRPLGMTASSYGWNEKTAGIAASPHGTDGQLIPDRRFTALAAAGLQTTMSDMMRFALASMNHLGGTYGTQGVLSEETLGLMLTPQAIKLPGPTSSLDPDVIDKDHDIFYGLGYQLSHVVPTHFASHGGVNEGWVALFYVAPVEGDGLVVMTNGSQGFDICLEIACRWIAGLTGEECTVRE